MVGRVVLADGLGHLAVVPILGRSFSSSPIISETQRADSGSITAWGKFMHLTEDEVRVKGLDIILRDLKEFPSRDSSFGSQFTGRLSTKEK